jgi:hypothetical protein
MNAFSVGLPGRMKSSFTPRLCSANIRSGTNRPRRGTFAEPWHDRGVIASARIVVGFLADMAGLVVPSATPLTRHRIGEPPGVRAGSVLGGLHHEHLPASA